MKEEGKSEHYKANYIILFVVEATFSHLTMIYPDFFPFLSWSYFLIPLSGDPKTYPRVDSAVPTNLGGLASWKTSNFNFWRTKIKKSVTFEEVLDCDSLSVVWVEVIPINLGLEDNFLWLVNFLEFNNEKRVGNSDKV